MTMRAGAVLLVALTVSAVAGRYGMPGPADPAPAAGPAVQIIDEPAAQFRFRILLGLTDQSPSQWDGKIRVSHGTITKIDGWLFERADEIQGTSGWKTGSRRSRPLGEPADLIPPEQWPIVPAGVIVS